MHTNSSLIVVRICSTHQKLPYSFPSLVVIRLLATLVAKGDDHFPQTSSLRALSAADWCIWTTSGISQRNQAGPCGAAWQGSLSSSC